MFVVLNEDGLIVLITDGPVKRSLLRWLPSSTSEASTMDVDSATTRAATKPATPAEPLPETEVYLRLLILYHITDSVSNFPMKRHGRPEISKLTGNPEELHARAVALGQETVERIHSLNRRSLDPIAAKAWFALGRVYEIKGNLQDLRP